LAKVWGLNYIELLTDYLDNGDLKLKTFRDEKRKVLFNHILPYLQSDQHNFKRAGVFGALRYYWQEEYFQELMDTLLLGKEGANNSSNHRHTRPTV